MPDLNALPTQRSPSLPLRSPAPPPLQHSAAATSNPHSPSIPTISPRSPHQHLHRRPSVNTAYADPANTPAGMPPTPSHHRAPSLGELHQELESEQEGQVNRLLGMIREQQAQILALQSGDAGHGALQDGQGHNHRSSMQLGDGASPLALSRQSSAASSRRRPLTPQRTPSGSPGFYWGGGGGGGGVGGGPGVSPGLERERDDAGRLQAETQMVKRENEMLQVRIRELEKMLAER